MEHISSLSREHVYVTVTGAAGTELVEMAFVNHGSEPDEDDWVSAAWDNITSIGADAKVLIGPDGVAELEDGTYAAWVRVTGAVERPVLKSGIVVIT